MAKANGIGVLWKVVGTVAAFILISCIAALAVTVDLARSNSHDIAALQTEQAETKQFRRDVTSRLRTLEDKATATNVHLTYLVKRAKKAD